MYAESVIQSRCDAVLLGRLGSELALIYHDTLQAPLPSGLKTIVDRLDSALNSRQGAPARKPIAS